MHPLEIQKGRVPVEGVQRLGGEGGGGQSLGAVEDHAPCLPRGRLSRETISLWTAFPSLSYLIFSESLGGPWGGIVMCSFSDKKHGLREAMTCPRSHSWSVSKAQDQKPSESHSRALKLERR